MVSPSVRTVLHGALLLAAALCAPALAAGEAEPDFRLGVVDERPERPDYMLGQMGPLHRVLSERLAARGVRSGPLVIAADLPDMASRLRAGTVDGVIEGVMPTLALERRTGAVDPAVLVWRKGQREYSSVFFVRADSDVEALGDLAGRTIVFEAPRSTSAFYVPMATLLEHGLDPRPAGPQAGGDGVVRYRFAGSELNQAYWVHRGEGDAGAFNDGDWARTPARLRDDLRIIHITPPLPRWLFSFREPVPPAVRRAVMEVLTHLHEDAEGRAALEAASRIALFEPLGAGDRLALEHWRPMLERIDERL